MIGNCDEDYDDGSYVEMVMVFFYFKSHIIEPRKKKLMVV